MIKKIVIILIGVFILSFVGTLIVFSSTDKINYKYNETINEEKAFTISESINQIDIKVTSGDINFILVDDTDEIKVKYYGEVNCIFCNTDFDLIGSKTENTIKFEEKNQQFFTGIRFNSNIVVDVYMPRMYEENLYVKSVSGDIYLNELSLDNLHLQTVSGDMFLNGLILGDAKFQSTSGDININDLTVSNKTYIDTVSGDISLDSVTTSVYAQSISGEIEALNLNGDFDAKTTSGDIDLREIGETFVINASSISGDIEIDVNSDSSFHFNIDTVSGDMNVMFEYIVSSNKDQYKVGRVGESNNQITIETTSGDIMIK